MSRIGLAPIKIPEGVKISINDKNNEVVVEGKKGKLSQQFDAKFKIAKEDNIIKILKPHEDMNTNYFKSLHGLTRNLIQNMIIGVNDGFQKKLIITGVGFKAQVNGKKLTLQIGYSHPVIFDIPEGIDIKIEDVTNLIVSGIDKQKVGQVTATIRSFRVPDPYKLKGIKIEGEYINKKAGKSGSTGEKK